MVLVDVAGSSRRRWRQAQGARWVMRLVAVQLALLGLWAASLVLTGAVFVGAFPLLLALLLVGAPLGGLLLAFARQRRWAWWVLLVLQLVSLPSDIALGRWVAVVVGVLLVALLLHPDSREWVAPEPDRVPVPGP